MFGAIHAPVPLPEGVLFALAGELTPRVESVGTDTVLLDLSGLSRVWRTPQAMGESVVESARGRAWSLQVALAYTRVAALVAARACPGLTLIAPGQEAAVLARLPIGVLDLSDERRDLFRRWGLVTLGDVAALPAKGLAERLGPEGPRLRRLARGEDDTPLVPTPAAETFDCRLELEWPVDGLEPLSFLLARVLDPLCASLHARHRRAAALQVELGLVDGRAHARRLKPGVPSADPRTWRTMLLLDLEAHPPGEAIQVIALRAEPTAARSVQFSLLDPAQPSPERLAETLARLHEWTAAGRGGAPALLDTHRPGAFVMESFAPPPRARASGDRPGRRGATPVREAPLREAPLREAPLRETAARPAAPRLGLRVYRPPLPAQVTLREGEPVFLAAGVVRGAVTDRAGPWRASGDWWDVAWSREEWDVAVGPGGVYRIFRDTLRGAWFVEGELD
jgi:protein ImuB